MCLAASTAGALLAETPGGLLHRVDSVCVRVALSVSAPVSLRRSIVGIPRGKTKSNKEQPDTEAAAQHFTRAFSWDFQVPPLDSSVALLGEAQKGGNRMGRDAKGTVLHTTCVVVGVCHKKR